jgi:hypothetical protein
MYVCLRTCERAFVFLVVVMCVCVCVWVCVCVCVCVGELCSCRVCARSACV